MTDTHVVLPEEVDNNDESIEHIRSLDTSMLYNYGEFHRKRSPEAKKLFELFLNFHMICQRQVGEAFLLGWHEEVSGRILPDL